MRKIINKKIYDTETAELIAEETSCQNGNTISWTSIYKTKRGNFFKHIVGNHHEIYAPADNIQPMTDAEALDELEGMCLTEDQQARIEKIFRGVIEEA